MKIQQHSAVPWVGRNLPAVVAPLDTVAISESPSRLKRVAMGLAKSAVGAAAAALPAAAVGYGISSLGGVAGGVLGGAVGATMGFVSGRELLAVARKLASSDPSKLNRAQRMAFKLGKAAPYVWALRSGVTAAAAGAMLHPAGTALMFGIRGAVAGSLFLGSK